MRLRFREEAVYIQVISTSYDTLCQLVWDLATAKPHLDRVLGTMRERSDLGDEILRGRRLLFLLGIEVEKRFFLCSAHISSLIIYLLGTIFIYLHPTDFIDASISFRIARAKINTFVWITNIFLCFLRRKIFAIDWNLRLDEDNIVIYKHI